MRRTLVTLTGGLAWAVVAVFAALIVCGAIAAGWAFFFPVVRE